jgi:hypothetical protein
VPKKKKLPPILKPIGSKRPNRMSIIRLGLVLTTFVIVGVVATIAGYYARGWRFDSKTGDFGPNGILVLKSVPDSAQIFINGELKTATNATIPLAPNTYDITLKKEGFQDWNKRVTIEKEVVTEATAYLFRAAPSLSSMTFNGITDLIPNDDLSKIAYIVPPSSDPLEIDNAGLWVMDILDLPLGFSRQPRKITDGDLTDATWAWSPDGTQILLTTKTGVYLLESNTLTSQGQRVNIAGTKNQTLSNWQKEYQTELDSRIESLLPIEMQDTLKRKAKAVVFSPDEKMVMYTASANATIPANLIPPLPGSSSQKEERAVQNGRTYIYDLEEDRNFLIDDKENTLIGDWKRFTTDTDIALPQPSSSLTPTLLKLKNPTATPTPQLKQIERSVTWFPTSRHIVLAEENKIVIMDYDGTNRKTIYSGSYISPHAYPSLTADRLFVLTNLGAASTPANLYSISLR